MKPKPQVTRLAFESYSTARYTNLKVVYQVNLRKQWAVLIL